jgi:hypothetical protein
MSGFAVDHVVIRTADRDGLVDQVRAATGLAPRDGFSQAGVLHSRGVRFAGGPFLDVFAAETPGTALMLGGRADAAERLAQAQGWAARVVRPEDDPNPPPWSMVLFRRGQGLLTQIGVIDYAGDPQAWTAPDYSGPLYAPGSAPRDGATLARVWLATADRTRAGRDLQALGYGPPERVRSGFWPREGERFRNVGADLVLCDGAEGVVRLDVATGGAAREVILPGGPTMVADEVT